LLKKFESKIKQSKEKNSNEEIIKYICKKWLPKNNKKIKKVREENL